MVSAEILTRIIACVSSLVALDVSLQGVLLFGDLFQAPASKGEACVGIIVLEVLRVSRVDVLYHTHQGSRLWVGFGREYAAITPEKTLLTDEDWAVLDEQVCVADGDAHTIRLLCKTKAAEQLCSELSKTKEESPPSFTWICRYIEFVLEKF